MNNACSESLYKYTTYIMKKNLRLCYRYTLILLVSNLRNKSDNINIFSIKNKYIINRIINNKSYKFLTKTKQRKLTNTHYFVITV